VWHFFACHHAIFRVAEAKQARGTGHCHTVVQGIAMRGKKDFHAMTLPRVVLAIATRGVLAITTHVVLTIATRGVL